MKDVNTYTMFNCSSGFRGILGKDPVSPTDQNFTIKDPDTPALNFKPSSYFQFGFSRNANLEHPFNSVNYNVSTHGWAVMEGLSSTTACPDDDSLPSKIYMGVAGRFSASSAKAGANRLDDQGLFSKTLYSDFAFSCTLEAHEVKYIWASGAVRSYRMDEAQISLLNMYIGQLSYFEQAANDDMSTDILQVALQPDSQSMANLWGELFSTRILSVIGGYTEAALNLEQQTRTEVLVAKVHIGGIWFLFGCSFGSALFVSWMAFQALSIARADPDIYTFAASLSFEKQLDQYLSVEKGADPDHDHTAPSAADPDAENAHTGGARPERSFSGNSSMTTLARGEAAE